MRLLAVLVGGVLAGSCSTTATVEPAAETDHVRGAAPAEGVGLHEIESRLGRLDEEIRNRLDRGDYHGAMRLLPAERQAWRELMARTGKYYEGAHGYLSGRTLFEAAERGDADWGKILDDPGIPYPQKTLLVFQILETRLGKGVAYVGDDRTSFIVSCDAPIDLDTLERGAGSGGPGK